ncbi:MAG: DUF1987 domain-containing protein [Defluviitaleaceae bacterium]|nr:DUF1987 domain-containing protein [Defluviitaleaceae bacterium]
MPFRMEKERTVATPYLLIDEEKNYMKLEGRCFDESMGLFFKEILDWLDIYLETDFGEFTFDNATEYFNSSTTKLLLKMLLKMDKYASDTKKIIVNWITIEENEIMVECGEDFMEELENIEFNIVIVD